MKQSNLSIDNIISQSILPKRKIIFRKKKTKFYKNYLDKKPKKDRNNNSLEIITKKFINYISKLNTDAIDIKNVVNVLNIKKRRIYDITNVLEGKYII